MTLDIRCRDTICALSSARGPAALAVVRASGPRALEIFEQIFSRARGQIELYRAMRGNVRNKQGRVLDDVMAMCFPEKQSFTGEPSFEIFTHGNGLIVDSVLKAICEYGARLAEPGEFSMRALLHNKIDLAQAESIADLIHAESEAALSVAIRGVRGGLHEKCLPVRESIISVLAEIEARMDFPDEDLGLADIKRLLQNLDQAVSILDNLLEHAGFALKLHEGMRVVICGAPNAGKSTLLNTLCGESRALVHESAGTTRDVIEARALLEGIPLVLVDVAGIRAAEEASPIEILGIQKANQELERADIVIWLADCTRDQPFGDELIGEALSKSGARVLKVLNKQELSQKPLAHLAISAEQGTGIGELKAALIKLVTGNASISGEIYITRARQRDELCTAREAFLHAREALEQKLADEIICSELRAAGLALDRLFGTTLGEDVLDRIFSQFCIGK